MSHVSAGPDTLQDVLRTARPGCTITLEPGHYGPVHLEGVKGPLRLQAEDGAVFDGGRRREDFDAEANAEARRLQDAGRYPGLYDIAMQGHVVLKNCRDITLSGLAFSGCWPTCIAIEACQGIHLDSIDFREGTFAIFATGATTRGLLIERCTFLQDITEHDMWRQIDWKQIHGGQPVLPSDVRALDGDFFRAFGIAGDVIIRQCHVRHAFNGVHIFHAAEDGKDPNSNRNVHVYNNRFDYIRDNAIEPERGGHSWWVFHNDIFNCHKIFSIEAARFGPAYVVGNCYWFDEKPTPEAGNNGGAIWKLHHDVYPGHGLTYALHNSFYLRSKYIKKERIFGFLHANNAIDYCDDSAHQGAICDTSQSFFGKIQEDDEARHFTKAWDDLDIRFVGDMATHGQFPDALLSAGYALERASGDRPGFCAPTSGDFRLGQEAAARGKGVALDVSLPDGDIWSLPSGRDIGAWQGERRIALPPQAYGAWPQTA
ncbi:MAG: hypothetical protein AAGF79_19275 [Pseudomonadota bacterium]